MEVELHSACCHFRAAPTFADLDARGWRYRSGFAVVSPAPGFRYEPTGEYPAESGVRLEFTFSQDERQAELCAIRAEDGPDVLDTLMVKLPTRDLERAAADVFATVLLETVAELCAERLS